MLSYFTTNSPAPVDCPPSKEAPGVDQLSKPSLVKMAETQKSQKEVVRHLLGRSSVKKHPVHGLSGGNLKISGQGYKSLNLDIAVPFDMTANSSGVLQFLTSGAILSTATDFTACTQLFDAMRCVAVSIIYEPISANSLTGGSGYCHHQPVIFAGDPEALTAPTFATLFASKLMTEPTNRFSSTDRQTKHTYAFPRLMLDFNSGTTPTFGQWVQTTASAVSACGGGIQISTRTDPNNASCVYGSIQIVYHCQFASRV